MKSWLVVEVGVPVFESIDAGWRAWVSWWTPVLGEYRTERAARAAVERWLDVGHATARAVRVPDRPDR